MIVFAGFDVHRAQITFDALDSDTGEVTRGRIDSTPSAVERWVARFPGREIHVAVEACTGWLFVCQALEHAGAIAHLAEHSRLGMLSPVDYENRPGNSAHTLDGKGAAPRRAHTTINISTTTSTAAQAA